MHQSTGFIRTSGYIYIYTSTREVLQRFLEARTVSPLIELNVETFPPRAIFKPNARISRGARLRAICICGYVRTYTHTHTHTSSPVIRSACVFTAVYTNLASKRESERDVRPCVVNTIRSCPTAACERVAYIIRRRQVSLSPRERSLAKSSSPPP